MKEIGTVGASAEVDEDPLVSSHQLSGEVAIVIPEIEEMVTGAMVIEANVKRELFQRFLIIIVLAKLRKKSL